MISCKLPASIPVLVLLPSVDESMMELTDPPHFLTLSSPSPSSSRFFSSVRDHLALLLALQWWYVQSRWGWRPESWFWQPVTSSQPHLQIDKIQFSCWWVQNVSITFRCKVFQFFYLLPVVDDTEDEDGKSSSRLQTPHRLVWMEGRLK